MAVAGDLESSETYILWWNSSSSPSKSSIFDDPLDADRYLAAVDALIASGRPSPESPALLAAMSRLDDELRRVLVARANDPDLDLQTDLSSLSINRSAEVDAPDAAEESPTSSPAVDLGAPVSIGRRRSRSSGRSMSCSFREMELFSPEAVRDLRRIAERMVAGGRGRECARVYSVLRGDAVDRSLRRLGLDGLSARDVQKVEFEARVRRWIRGARICVRVVLASELSLFQSVFEGIPGLSSEGNDGLFMGVVGGSVDQLLESADGLGVSDRSTEKLFKILDLYDALSDLLPDIASIFGEESVYARAVGVLSRLAEAVRGILSEFETAVLRDPSRTVVPGGTIHPITRYVMNYISLISDYKATLMELIVTRPSVGSRLTVEDPSIACPLLPDIDVPELENRDPIASHLIWIIAVLQHNLESKSEHYKDAALAHLFIMNNVHYIVNKVKDSPELRGMIGDDYLRKLTGKYRLAATSYQRASWIKVLHCLRDEGIQVSGRLSSGVSKSALRERFKSFNMNFDEVHRSQSAWSVPDEQLKEELQISISERLLPAYRSFLGRFRQHIENGRHPETYIKYSVEDLEMAISDFFQGIPHPVLSRRWSH